MLPTYEEIQRHLAVYEKKYRNAIRARAEYRRDVLHQGKLDETTDKFQQKCLNPCLHKLNDIRNLLRPNDYCTNVNNRILQKHARVSYAIDAMEIIINDMLKDSCEVRSQRTDAFGHAAIRFEFYNLKTQQMKKKVDELTNRLRVKNVFKRIKAKRAHDKQYAKRF